MKPYLVLGGMLLVALGSAQAETYRWVDQSGKVHYGDQPAEEATQVELRNLHVAPEGDDAGLPYESRLARQNFPVTFYSTNDCGDPCQQARDFLNKRGIPFTKKSVLQRGYQYF